MTVEATTTAAWSAESSEELYRVRDWGGGYFAVSERGTMIATVDGEAAVTIDLHDVAKGLAARGIEAPVILRFPEILHHRMGAIREAFDRAAADIGFRGGYTCVYPIKVNQERHLCEAVCAIGKELGFGIEVGSKPELIAGLRLTRGMNGMPLVCNGFKDAEYIETVTLAAKMGRNVIPVVEQVAEMELIARAARSHDVKPRFGVRAKLAATGVGRWADSAGMRGKFGLTVAEILHAIDHLKREDMLDGFRLLHCHVGSQIFDIRVVKYIVSELTHLYVELVRAGAPIEILDFGGGLGVDYDGTHSAADSSANYTVDQYAADIVHRVHAICEDAGVPHPNIMTESGRALVAHSSVLVCEVIGTRTFPDQPDLGLVHAALAQEDPPQPLLDAWDAYQRPEDADVMEIFADTEHALTEARGLFNLGYMDLHSRAACEELFWAAGHRALARLGEDLPESLQSLPEGLADLYFLNLSIFQSLLDSWGIGQLFPIVPLHRLDEEPTRSAVLVDMTCDSDGRVDRFPGPVGPKHTLELHPMRAGDGPEPERYYLGIFLTGAYQETLGDLHNLLGDTHAVHVVHAGQGRWRIDCAIEGDTVAEVLGYVQFDPEEIRTVLAQDIEDAHEAGRLSLPESASLRAFLDEGLRGYTYLE